MSVRYDVQKLDGYTDGKPSWTIVARKRNRDDAELEMALIQKSHPSAKLRVRKNTRK